MTTIRSQQPAPGRSGSGAPEPAGGGSPGTRAAEARSQIEHEHRLLWSLVERLERSSDVQALALRLGELRDLLAAHFAREEATGGLREAVDEPRWEGALEALFDEHSLCLAEVNRLALGSRELLAGPVEELRRDVRALCQRLHAHEAAETELLAASLYDETGGGD